MDIIPYDDYGDDDKKKSTPHRKKPLHIWPYTIISATDAEEITSSTSTPHQHKALQAKYISCMKFDCSQFTGYQPLDNFE